MRRCHQLCSRRRGNGSGKPQPGERWRRRRTCSVGAELAAPAAGPVSLWGARSGREALGRLRNAQRLSLTLFHQHRSLVIWSQPNWQGSREHTHHNTHLFYSILGAYHTGNLEESKF